eukprot:764306-Hanusia_phi.AAC.1
MNLSAKQRVGTSCSSKGTSTTISNGGQGGGGDAAGELEEASSPDAGGAERVQGAVQPGKPSISVDEDKGGSISPQELGSLMETLGLKPNQVTRRRDGEERRGRREDATGKQLRKEVVKRTMSWKDARAEVLLTCKDRTSSTR